MVLPLPKGTQRHILFKIIRRIYQFVNNFLTKYEKALRFKFYYVSQINCENLRKNSASRQVLSGKAKNGTCRAQLDILPIHLYGRAGFFQIFYISAFKLWE